MGNDVAVRYEIRVELPFQYPENRCDAAQCPAELAGHVVYLLPDWSRVEAADVCSLHIEYLRSVGAPCLIFPKGQLPPPSRLVPLVKEEIRRRTQPRTPQYFGGTNVFGMTTTGGPSLNFGTVTFTFG